MLMAVVSCDEETEKKESENKTENKTIDVTKGEDVKTSLERVRFETSLGNFDVELDEKNAPITVKNFLTYVDEKFYEGTIFHRVINDFMIQGGGFTKDMAEKTTHSPIKNEATNGLRNDQYTIAMARTNVVDSASSQFFINVKDNSFLNYVNSAQYGYAVFGKVVSGTDVVDKIKAVSTTVKNGYSDVPATPVVIQKVVRISQ